MKPLEQFSVLRIEGADAAAFLHAQLSNNIASLSEGDSCFAAYCEPKGRVLAVVLVHRQGSVFFLVLHQSLETTVARRLQMYVLRSDVSVTSCAESNALYGFSANPEGLAVCWPYPLPGSRCLWLADSADPAPSGSMAMTGEQWNFEDIQAGLAWLDDATSAQHLPQALNLVSLGAIDFNKGCYPGQEIVARTHYLGTIKRQLIRITIPESDSICSGQTLFLETAEGNEQQAGQVVAVSRTKAKSALLAVVKTSICGHKLNYYFNDKKLQTSRILEENTLF